MIFSLTTTKLGQPCVEMRDPTTKELIAKMYPSQDFSKFRIVFPELVSMKQTRIDVDSHYIEFRRSVDG